LLFLQFCWLFPKTFTSIGETELIKSPNISPITWPKSIWSAGCEVSTNPNNIITSFRSVSFELNNLYCLVIKAHLRPLSFCYMLLLWNSMYYFLYSINIPFLLNSSWRRFII
jgi:hypothetical protein